LSRHDVLFCRDVLIYIVPDYQREYVWTDKELQQLLDDITAQIDGAAGREYFIGTVLV
jgi:uncharacterized protein with ParB-like and HNH nuclease domain